MPQIIACFPHYGLAYAVYDELHHYGIRIDPNDIISMEHGNYINNDRFFHLLQQGYCLLKLEVTEDDFIFVYEVICAFGGNFELLHNEVFQRMYQIPEESYEQFHKRQVKENAQQKSRYDLLDDEAYIDPNIGLGDYDLLNPIFDEYEDEYLD